MLRNAEFEALGSEIDNTLIVLSSDHGELLGDYGCYGKRSMLNPSVRFPLVARLPNQFPENVLCDTPTTLLDLYPTFTSLAKGVAECPNPEGVNLFDVAAGAQSDRVVFSQFSSNELGLYMAVDRKWKYIYSAADNKEWLFDLENDPKEISNKVSDEACQAIYLKLKKACIERFARDGYDAPIEGGDWKQFEAPALPERDSDEGLLFQDPQSLGSLIDSLGRYARCTKFTSDAKYQMLDRLWDVARVRSQEHIAKKDSPDSLLIKE